MSATYAQLANAEKRPCEYCGCERVVLRRTIGCNGAVMYFWLCAECQWHARREGQWISHEVIDEWVKRRRLDSPENVPIHVAYESENRCVVCGRAGVEYHHWAPQSMKQFFGDDWARWPGAYLCKMHHDLWHEVVTPYLHGRRNTERALEVKAWAEEAS